MTRGQKASNLSLIFSLLNCQKLSYQKIPELNKITENDHFTLCTEVNLESEQHQNILESDSDYIWHFIPKSPGAQQRIGVRVPAHLSRFIKFEFENFAYIPGRVKKSIKDETAIQWVLFKAQIYHINLRIMVIYRVPDALDAATQQLYSDIEIHSPTILAGDFNIDYKKKKNKDAMQQKLPATTQTNRQRVYPRGYG